MISILREYYNALPLGNYNALPLGNYNEMLVPYFEMLKEYFIG